MHFINCYNVCSLCMTRYELLTWNLTNDAFSCGMGTADQQTSPAASVMHLTALYNGKFPGFYSRGVHFISQPSHRLSWLKVIVVFLSSTRREPRRYLNYPMAASFQIFSKFIITESSYHRYCVVSGIDIVVKLPCKENSGRQALRLALLNL